MIRAATRHKADTSATLQIQSPRLATALPLGRHSEVERAAVQSVLDFVQADFSLESKIRLRLRVDSTILTAGSETRRQRGRRMKTDPRFSRDLLHT